MCAYEVAIPNTFSCVPTFTCACVPQCRLHPLPLLCAGHTHGMAVPAKFFASPVLLDMVVSEAQASTSGSGGFVASLQQLSNVATLPGIVGERLMSTNTCYGSWSGLQTHVHAHARDTYAWTRARRLLGGKGARFKQHHQVIPCTAAPMACVPARSFVRWRVLARIRTEHCIAVAVC